MLCHVNLIPLNKVEETGFTIGDRLGNKLKDFTPNENYKTEIHNDAENVKLVLKVLTNIQSM